MQTIGIILLLLAAAAAELRQGTVWKTWQVFLNRKIQKLYGFQFSSCLF